MPVLQDESLKERDHDARRDVGIEVVGHLAAGARVAHQRRQGGARSVDAAAHRPLHAGIAERLGPHLDADAAGAALGGRGERREERARDPA